MMSELKPCPFCGGEAEVYLAARYEDKDYYHVRCTNDCVYTKKARHNENEAIEAWNTRYEPTCKWELTNRCTWTCSNCGIETERLNPYWRHCPNCGAKVVNA